MLVLLYTLTVSGVALNLHFCGSKIASVKVATAVQAKGKATCGSTKMKCCKDKHVDVKVKDSHQAEQVSMLGKLFAFHLPKLPFEDFMFSTQQSLLEKLYDRGPPPQPLQKVSAFIKNSIFRL